MRRKSDTIDFVEFPAPDPGAVAAAKQFYTGVFGWEFSDWGDDYADTKSSGLASGFNADPAHRPRMPLVVIFTKDLAGARGRVVAAGGTITKEIFSFPGGQRFHFTHPCGNILAVWSDR